MSNITIPDYTESYTPQKESIKFFSWNNLMFGEEVNKTPKNHYMLVDAFTTKHNKFVGMCHRGFAKTTILSHKFPLYVASMGRFPNFGPIKNAVLLSDTFDQADNQLKSIVAYYNNSEPLKAILTLVKEKQGQLIFENNKGDRFQISARGAGQSFRGTSFEGQRPQWIIGDDLLSDDILFNKELNEKVIKWWSSVVAKAIDIERYKMTVIGTPLLQDDLLARLINNKQWTGIKFPVAHDFPVTRDKIISSWADRFTPDKIMDEYEESKELGTENEFFREMMLQVVTDETRVFKHEWFKDYAWDSIKKDKMKYNFFTTMDLAVSQKEHADYTAIITIAVNADGHWFIARIDYGRINPSQVIDLLFKHVRQYRPLEVRAGKAALQQVLGHFIEERMIKENTHFLYNPLEANSKMSKEFRILSLQPKMQRRMIHFPTDRSEDGVMELRHELLGFTKEGATTKHDDLADCLANFMDEGFIVTPSDYKEEYYHEMGNMVIEDPTLI